MKRSIFKPSKRRISVREYLDETLINARHIRESSKGRQRYTGAQFELALFSFWDIKQLKQEMDPELEVNFLEVEAIIDWGAGFDWLDLSVSYKDKDAINYFQKKLEDSRFQKQYQVYKSEIRPDCSLQNYEIQKPVISPMS